MRRFDHFLAIDWSGAAGERHRGIALALAHAEGGPPVPVEPPHPRGWSRGEVLALLLDLPDGTLVGMDLGISLPHADCGAFFPGWEASPACARELWALIDSLAADDDHLAASSFVDHHEIAPFFRRHGGREGARFRAGPIAQGAAPGRGRLRVTEHAQAAMGLKPYSNFNLVGAAQVGKSSLTGMRLLHRLAGRLPVWPIDPLPPRGSVVCEIYTSLAAIEAGRSAARAKMRSFEELNAALGALGSPPVPGEGPLDDHSCDAALTAAWLRAVHREDARWNPRALTPAIAATEGWTFGAF
ncbi:hypothetical protein [Erythrobacter sp.]|uniref:hypothetical protein n=1 Tax=Erythrobacter sp. TaxID=1042 RepID=UPI001425CFE6|nr:hypothetical protein [Erythrobacter sp.]QIQ86794.1 MAG: hypothetical protein G9473_08910 [Erythrobacter sp.]